MLDLRNEILRQNAKHKLMPDEDCKSNSSWKFYISKHEFRNYVISICKAQWTKTQKGYFVRIDNYNTGKNHYIHLPIDTLKDCKKFIDTLKETGSAGHWTGHYIKSGEFIKDIY